MQLIMVMATTVGLTSGMIAVLMQLLVPRIQYELGQLRVLWHRYLILHIVRLVLTAHAVRRFLGGYIEKGSAMVLKAIARKSSFVPLAHTYQHIITSSITVGFGGSAGLEAPIVATGSAVGSNLARITDLNYQERTLLIACGAAAGISAVFN